MRVASDFRRLLALVLVVLLSSSLYAGVSPGIAQSSPTTLTLSRTGFTDVGSLNPYSPEGVYGIYIELYQPFAANAFPPLPQLIPVIGKDWSHNGNYTQWILNLREGLKWDDGSPLNATDLWYSVLLTNQTTSLGASQFTIINSTAVKVIYSAPNYHFDTLDLGSIGIDIVPYEVFSKVTNMSSFANLQNIVADGPFVLYNYTEGTNPIVFTANPYFFLGVPHIQRIVLSLFNSFSSALATYEAGGLDGLWSNGAYAAVRPLYNVSGSTLIESVPATVQAVLFNDWVYPLNLTVFRQALAYATNTTAINDILNGPFASSSGIPWDALLPQYNQQLGFSAAGPVTYRYDLTKAGQMLNSLGFKLVNGHLQYPNGTAVSITINVNGGSADAPNVATLVQQMWDKLGIDVSVVALSSSSILDLVSGNTGWQAIVDTNAPSTPGPSNGPGILSEETGYSVTDINSNTLEFNSTFYNDTSAAEQYPSNSTLFNKYAGDAARIFAEQVPMIPLYIEANWVAVSNNFYWGNPTQHTGIYNPQAVVNQLMYYETLSLVQPLQIGTTSTSSGPSSTSSTSVTSSQTTAPTTSGPNYYLYAGVAVVIVVILAAAAVWARRRH